MRKILLFLISLVAFGQHFETPKVTEKQAPVLSPVALVKYWQAEAEAQRADFEALRKHIVRDAARDALVKQCGDAVLVVSQDLTLSCSYAK